LAVRNQLLSHWNDEDALERMLAVPWIQGEGGVRDLIEEQLEDARGGWTMKRRCEALVSGR
jgi:hypothetical protein